MSEQTPSEAPEQPQAAPAPTPAEVFGGKEPAAVPAEPPAAGPAPTGEPAEAAVDYRALYEKAQAEARALADAAKAADAEAADYKNRLAEMEVSVLRHQEAARVNLPADLAARLRGETPEEIAADARKLAALVAPKPVTGKGGLEPDAPAEHDPEAITRRIRAISF
ncbi:hypothetical protein J1792_15215 [Streptomyces triculaminicus]|uniref:Scaffolding protein n=1 Tax=Streptomyces triculaminicus TaxID=2816232 RepID=A0A939JRY0_9ACTN|nr:hypothetical protein [Streptomyces triculaminicus]MBO0654074.1 hypothetical protein [Streptomyces triculaminicus]